MLFLSLSRRRSGRVLGAPWPAKQYGMQQNFYVENRGDMGYCGAPQTDGYYIDGSIAHSAAAEQEAFNKQFERMHELMQPSGSGIDDTRQEYHVMHAAGSAREHEHEQADGDDSMQQSPPVRHTMLHCSREDAMDDTPRTSEMHYGALAWSDADQVVPVAVLLESAMHVPRQRITACARVILPVRTICPRVLNASCP